MKNAMKQTVLKSFLSKVIAKKLARWRIHTSPHPPTRGFFPSFFKMQRVGRRVAEMALQK